MCSYAANAETIRCSYAEYEWIVQPAKYTQPSFDLANLSLIEEQSVVLDVIKNQEVQVSISLTTGTKVNYTILMTDTSTKISIEKDGFTHTSISNIKDFFPGGPIWTSSSYTNQVSQRGCELIKAN